MFYSIKWQNSAMQNHNYFCTNPIHTVHQFHSWVFKKRYMYTYVYCSIVYNSQDMEAI